MLHAGRVSNTRTCFVHALDMPALDMPALDMPALDMPALDMPALDMPALDMPALDMPALDMPALDMPALDMPALDMPALDMPACPRKEPADTVRQKGHRCSPTLHIPTIGHRADIIHLNTPSVGHLVYLG